MRAVDATGTERASALGIDKLALRLYRRRLVTDSAGTRNAFAQAQAFVHLVHRFVHRLPFL